MAYGPDDPRNARVVIDACKPFTRRDSFPIVVRSSTELDERILDRPRGEEEADHVEGCRIRRERPSGQVIGDPQPSALPVCDLAGGALQLQRGSAHLADSGMPRATIGNV